MTDDAHHMSLLTLLIQGVAHRLAVDGQTLISRAIDFVPALQGLVQMRGGDADQHIAQDVLAGHDITTLFATAAKALSRFLRSEEHTSELQSPYDLVCRLLL